MVGKRQLADVKCVLVRRWSRGPGVPKAPPAGREALEAVSTF